ncbi:AraC family transcriptional regulator [Burkholderia stagnalis]
MTDPLSDLWDFLQARCILSGRIVAGGTWARRFTNLDAIKFCAVTEGACWYAVDGMSEPARVIAGDVLIISGTRTLTLASAADLVPGATTTPVVQDGDDQYRLGAGRDFTMLGGHVRIDADRQALLRSGLPPIIHVRGTTAEAKPLSWLLEQLAAEMQDGRPGRTTVISALAQLLFIQTLRAYLAHASEGDEGWLKGFGDQRLAIVLSSIHGEPSRNWGLEELAKKAGMSRTSLAVRFREMMGIPPLAYLTQWRMYLARRELQAGASISDAAAAVGYTSESAFSSAFKRVMAVAPGQYRRMSRRENAMPQTAGNAGSPEF